MLLSIIANPKPARVFCSKLAKFLGSADKAIIVQQCFFWLQKCGRKLEDGKYWFYQPRRKWIDEDNLSWLSERKIRRYLEELCEIGLIQREQKKVRRADRTYWYTINWLKFIEIAEKNGEDPKKFFAKLLESVGDKAYILIGSLSANNIDNNRDNNIENININKAKQGTKNQEKHLTEKKVSEPFPSLAEGKKENYQNDLSVNPEENLSREVEQKSLNDSIYKKPKKGQNRVNSQIRKRSDLTKKMKPNLQKLEHRLSEGKTYRDILREKQVDAPWMELITYSNGKDNLVANFEFVEFTAKRWFAKGNKLNPYLDLDDAIAHVENTIVKNPELIKANWDVYIRNTKKKSDNQGIRSRSGMQLSEEEVTSVESAKNSILEGSCSFEEREFARGNFLEQNKEVKEIAAEEKIMLDREKEKEKERIEAEIRRLTEAKKLLETEGETAKLISGSEFASVPTIDVRSQAIEPEERKPPTEREYSSDVSEFKGGDCDVSAYKVYSAEDLPPVNPEALKMISDFVKGFSSKSTIKENTPENSHAGYTSQLDKLNDWLLDPILKPEAEKRGIAMGFDCERDEYGSVIRFFEPEF